MIKVEDLSVINAHPVNSYHDTVEISRATLCNIVEKCKRYEQALVNCLSVVDKACESETYTTNETAMKVAVLSSKINYEYYAAMRAPIISSSFDYTKADDNKYKSIVINKMDSSG